MTAAYIANPKEAKERLEKKTEKITTNGRNSYSKALNFDKALTIFAAICLFLMV